jgi:hypothetical protein
MEVALFTPDQLKRMAEVAIPVPTSEPQGLIPVADTPNPLRERVIEGFSAAVLIAEQQKDENAEAALKTLKQLSASGVQGSRVLGIRSLDDAKRMLSEVTNWTEVVSGSPDITILQGELPKTYSAYAGYAEVRQIWDVYGDEGARNIQVKKGTHAGDQFYLGTLLDFPTNLITVQLQNIDLGGVKIEAVIRWFAGKDKTTFKDTSEGGCIVRCSNHLAPLQRRQPTKHATSNTNRRGNSGGNSRR